MSILFDVIKGFQGKDTSKVSDQERIKRTSICNTCPNLKFGTNCGLCGCFVSDKASYKDESCPDGKW